MCICMYGCIIKLLCLYAHSASVFVCVRMSLKVYVCE